MGDPRKQRKKFETPRFPWRTDVLEAELKLLGQYGLRNKKEMWRHKALLSKYRGIARSLLGMSVEERRKLEKNLLDRLYRLGILPETSVLDDVLVLSLEDILERRLQTLVFQKGLAKSIYQARQFITHGHVAIAGRRVSSPSYLVLREEDVKITYSPTSPLLKSSQPQGKSVASPAKVKSAVEEEKP